MTEGTLTREQFMKDLLGEWRARKAQYSFLGFEGDEYNHWLEHRHGWPVTEDGLCGPSAALSLDDGGDPVEWGDCSVCRSLVSLYKARGGKEPVYVPKAPEGISCARHEDGSVSFCFPEGVRDLRFLGASGGFEVKMSKEQYDRWSKAHLAMTREAFKRVVRRELTSLKEALGKK